jgi:sulfite exporter TauE/SafE
MEIWTGFVVGLLGSLHCIGMCGPIVIALPNNSESKLAALIGRILYNLGRITTYTTMGFIFGFLGSGFVLYGLQQYLSVAFGVIIILYVITPRKIKTSFSSNILYKSATKFIKEMFSKLLSKKTQVSFFSFGLLNGLLPCAFVYVGLAGAISTGNLISGTLYMMLFGVGTFPVMLAASLFGNIVNIKIKRKVNKLIPIFAVLLAFIFILRGLNLGIPYLSPKFSKSPISQQKMMHH